MTVQHLQQRCTKICSFSEALLDRRRMAAGDRPNLQAGRCKRSNPAAEAFQLWKSASARKGLCRWREEIWDAAAKQAAAPLVSFSVLHEPMDVQLHYVINKGSSWREKLSFSHTASLDAVWVKYQKGTEG